MNVRRLILILILYASAFSQVQGQDFRSAYEEFSATSRQKHRNFTDSLNVEFSKAVRSNWEQFHLYEAESGFRSPNPVSPFVARESDGKSEGVLGVSEMVDTLPADVSIMFNEHSAAASLLTRSVIFSFYDCVQEVTIPARYGSFHPSGISEKAVGDFWDRLGRENFSGIVGKCLDNRDRLGYNDWAVSEWVQALSEAIFPENINSERTIFEVFIMNQMGMMVKLARADDRLVGLFASLQPVFARKFIIIDTYKYYLTDSLVPVTSLFTYSQNFNGKLRPLDLRLKNSLVLGTEDSFFIRHFKSSVFACDLEIPLNRGIISFYNKYPQTTINVYAQSVPDERFSNSLMRGITPGLSGLDNQGMLNELLRFLQYDFRYKVDTEQFGYEKQFFCEENFQYEANDCEDRAVLFSFLVRKMTGCKVILLEYENHIATAVRLDEDVKGRYFRLADGRYYICDPTFIGAKVGMCIPEYVEKQARIYML